MKFARPIVLVAVAACASERKPEVTLSAANETAPSVAEAAQGTTEESTEAQPPSSTPPQEAPGSTVDLSRERALLDESAAALKASDYSTARAKAAQGVTSLLARPEAEQDAAWLALLDSLGFSAASAEDTPTANTAWQRVLDIRSRTLPDDHPDLQRTRANLAATIEAQGDLAGARALEEKVLEISSRTLPDDHPALQRTRGNLALTMFTQGDLAGARALEEKVLEVFSRTLPDDHPDLQRARGNLALTMYAQGDLAGARALQGKVLEVDSRTLPEDHPSLQRAREGLAATIEAQGDLVGARALEEKVVEVFSRTLPDDDPDLQRARGNLGATIKSLGDLAGARALEQDVLEVLSRTLPDDHPDLQWARGILAATIAAQGDLAGARELEEKVLGVRSRTLPDDHPDLARARQALAATMYDLGDFAGARALDELVLEVLSRTLPDDHPDLQWARGNLATTIGAQGDLAGARALEEKVLEVRSRTLPEDHSDLQLARQNLAGTMYKQGDLSGARALFEKVLEVFSRTLPDDHPDLQWARGNLAATIAADHARLPGGGEGERTAEKARGRERCAELILSQCRAQTRAVRSVLLSSPSREAEERCASLAESLDVALSFARGLGVFDRSRELEPASFVLSETARGAAIMSAGLTRKAAGTPKYTRLREALVRASDELAALSQKGTTNEVFDAARTKREAAERELIALAREVSGGKLGGVDLDVSSLAARLGEHSTAVSFRRFKDTRIEVGHDSGAGVDPATREISTQRLCAFVVRGGQASNASQDATERFALVDLGSIEPIERAVREWRDALGVAKGRGVSVSSSVSSPDPRASGDTLRRLVFDPLLAAIGERERIVLELDDVLHLVAFDALPLDASAKLLVGDRWKIETRATLSELWNEDPLPASEASLLALGGVSYEGGEQETALAAMTSAAVSVAPGADTSASRVEVPASPIDDLGSNGKASAPKVSVAAILRGGPWSGGFAELPATAYEVEGVGDAFIETFGADAKRTLLERAQATRERMLELAPKAGFLHIATHGWFAPESIKSWSDPEPLDKKSGLGMRLSGREQVKGMSPMLLCGLALAGANLPENAVGRAPGLVTAEELSTLDLTNCELVVLSACDTNVGERRAGQGVASLQKALQMAGARSVITSLWKVPDEATKDLMLDFYRRLWVEKKPKWQALWEAKMKIRNAKDKAGKPKYTTRDWAAWVLTGNPD